MHYSMHDRMPYMHYSMHNRLSSTPPHPPNFLSPFRVDLWIHAIMHIRNSIMRAILHNWYVSIRDITLYEIWLYIEVWGVKGARRTPNGKGSCQTHERGWQSPGSLSGTGTLFSATAAPAPPQQCCSYSMYKNCNVALIACIILFAYALYCA